jgi:hypothetical protein
MYFDSDTIHIGEWMYIAVLNFRYWEETLLSRLVSNTKLLRAETPGISTLCDTEFNTKRDNATLS